MPTVSTPTASTFRDYTPSPAGSPGHGSGVAQDDADSYWTLSRCKRAYTDYLGTKREEILEQQDARRYRHAVQWTAAQIAVFNKRKQPVVTFNRVGRKIDGIVGLVEKLRQDPKAYPRTPKHEQGAELATAALRYALESQDWKAKAPLCAEDGAVDGIGGIELELTEGDQGEGDREIGFDVIEPESFFYDPRSSRMDFSDARFMGIGKWVDSEAAKEMFPDKADEIDSSLQSGSDLTTNSDKEQKWFMSDSESKRIRLVDIWYMHKGGWCWCLFTGSLKLMEGKSYIFDEKGKPTSKFIVFSACVDQDGDRYGFVRNLKSAQDEINQRRSKGLHELNTRRVIGEVGAFTDVEESRREAARPDGFVLRNKGFEAQFDDTAKIANIEGQFKFLEDAKNEIENFGPNPALIGQGIENKSGRAISLLQQAGIAELGPFILSYRGWKIRVYRAMWSAIQRNWTAERWIRVTDDEGVAQFVQVNGVQVDPQTGLPTLVNAIGSLDVDIILDEGPDQVNMMADAYDTLTALAGKGAQVPPELLIELSPLQSSVKKRAMDILEKAKQADPAIQQAKQIELAQGASSVKETDSKTMLNLAKAHAEGMPDQVGPGQPQPQEVPVEVQTMETLAKIGDTHAAEQLKRAQAAKIGMDTMLAPAKMHQDAQNAEADREQQAEQFRRQAQQRSSAPRNGA